MLVCPYDGCLFDRTQEKFFPVHFNARTNKWDFYAEPFCSWNCVANFNRKVFAPNEHVTRKTERMTEIRLMTVREGIPIDTEFDYNKGRNGHVHTKNGTDPDNCFIKIAPFRGKMQSIPCEHHQENVNWHSKIVQTKVIDRKIRDIKNKKVPGFFLKK